MEHQLPQVVGVGLVEPPEALVATGSVDVGLVKLPGEPAATGGGSGPGRATWGSHWSRLLPPEAVVEDPGYSWYIPATLTTMTGES